MPRYDTLVQRCRQTNSLLADDLDAAFRGDWDRIRQYQNRIVELEAEQDRLKGELAASVHTAIAYARREIQDVARIEKLELALSKVAGKNNLEGVQDDLIWSAMANALQECELISREALG